MKDPADDGPEVELIQFFYFFPDGGSKILMSDYHAWIEPMWQAAHSSRSEE